MNPNNSAMRIPKILVSRFQKLSLRITTRMLKRSNVEKHNLDFLIDINLNFINKDLIYHEDSENLSREITIPILKAIGNWLKNGLILNKNLILSN